MPDMKELSINERVKRCRKMCDMRQEDLAAAMGMKASTYSQMERTGEITAVRLIQIADILGISPNLLFYGTEEKEQPIIDPTTKHEKPGGLGQPNPVDPIIVTPKKFTPDEEKYFTIVRDFFPKKYKEELFEYIQEKYKEIKYKNIK